MKSPNPNHAIAVILGACLFACNSPSDPVTPVPNPGAPAESGSEFDRSALSIKAGPHSQQEKISALQALASRHGHVVVPQANPDPGPNLVEAEKPVAGTLGKTSAVYIMYHIMKSQTFGNDFALEDFRIVKHNQTLTAWTTRPAGSTADPFLVAVHDTKLFPDKNAMLTKVVGLNDDDAGLDSRFSWKNTSGSDKGVQITAFAYTNALSGRATLHTTIDGGSKRTFTGSMGGFAHYDNHKALPIAGCTGPYSERLSLQVLERGDARYEAMMVNSQTMTGGQVNISTTGPNVTLDIPTLTPSGYPSFLLVYASGSATTNGSYVGRQYQRFTCQW